MMYLMRWPDDGKRQCYKLDEEEALAPGYGYNAEHTTVRRPHAWRWDSNLTHSSGYSAIAHTPDHAEVLIRELRLEVEAMGARACA